ncbi:MAG: hypothetical protein QNJ41_10345 [Xenococcaceae cyanobacterium MO_188.B32]|nr:hypothetical protein [Xenococcaceae cyanobacterium MO_188.B32]
MISSVVTIDKFQKNCSSFYDKTSIEFQDRFRSRFANKVAIANLIQDRSTQFSTFKLGKRSLLSSIASSFPVVYLHKQLIQN